MLRRFQRDADGGATVEFVMVFPFFLILFLFCVELGFMTARYALLERGLDMTVREIRLGTGANWEHNQIKDSICENAIFVGNCKNALRLEMRPRSIRQYTSLGSTVDCTDRAEDTDPVAFQTGGENQLMILRACYKFTPLFPTELLGSMLEKDTSGDAAVIATTAFVQEPE
jgi:Flp pilus assembly protein TadG